MNELMATALSAVTLGVSDLDRARRYYASVFEPVDAPGKPGPCYVRLPGTWLALYPRDALAKYFGLDAGDAGGFGGVTLSVNVAGPDDVDALCARLRDAGGQVTVPPGQAPWGGRIACVSDPDGHPMELVWNPRGMS
jgi:catechol 2,3-dioxygenase-like lactoylglutathione lyase family enzyme